MNVDDVATHARLRPTVRAVFAAGDEISWKELDCMTEIVAGQLLERRIGRNQRVANACREPVAFLIATCSTIRLGAVTVPLPVHLSTTDMTRLIAVCEPSLIVTDTIRDLTDTEARRTLELQSCSLIERARALSASRAIPKRVPHGAPRPSDIFSIFYSSGTTGFPKGVVRSYGAHARSRALLARHNRIDSHTLTMICNALYTPMALSPMLMTLYAGGACAFSPSTSANDFFDASLRLKPTFAQFVPTFWAMLASEEAACREAMASYERVVVGGAKLHASYKRKAIEMLPCSFSEMYGASESGAITDLPGRSPTEKLDSVGQLLEDVEVRVLGDGDVPSEPGTVGEIVARTSRMMVGYDRDPEQTNKAFWTDPASSSVFYRTGDIGSLDGDGYVWLHDRRKDMIITGGFNVYPSDIERQLLSHRDVSEVAVIGVAHGVLGETPVAFIVPKVNVSCSEEELCAWANERLGAPQRLLRVYFANELPKNAAGKVIKSELKTRACYRSNSAES